MESGLDRMQISLSAALILPLHCSVSRNTEVRRPATARKTSTVLRHSLRDIVSVDEVRVIVLFISVYRLINMRH